jgi:hypothetical protein
LWRSNSFRTPRTASHLDLFSCYHIPLRASTPHNTYIIERLFWGTTPFVTVETEQALCEELCAPVRDQRAACTTSANSAICGTIGYPHRLPRRPPQVPGSQAYGRRLSPRHAAGAALLDGRLCKRLESDTQSSGLVRKMRVRESG